MKKILTKKRLKKINKALGNPTVRYVSGTLFSLAAFATLKVIEEKFPVINDVLVTAFEERKKTIDTFYSEDELMV